MRKFRMIANRHSLDRPDHGWTRHKKLIVKARRRKNKEARKHNKRMRQRSRGK